MGMIITTAATMFCPHFGTITGTVADSRRATAGGAQILTESDTFTIKGCTFNISGGPHPCVSVRWIAAATKVKTRSAVITTDSLGLCVAADQAPQGPPQLVPAQTKASAI